MSSDSSKLLPEQRPVLQSCYGTAREQSPKESMDLRGYQKVLWRVILCHVFTVLTAGLPLILFHWKPHIAVFIKCRSCALRQADYVIIQDSSGQQYTIDIITEEIDEESVVHPGIDLEEDDWRDTVQLHKEQKTVLRYYTFEGMRYIWMPKKGGFYKVSTLDENWTIGDVHRRKKGLSLQDQASNSNHYYLGSIPVSVCDVLSRGDNILTAVNVAQNCGMVATGERIIFVHASPPVHHKPATLKFLLAESGTYGQDSAEVITQGLYQQGSHFLDQGPYHLALNGKSFAVLCEHFRNILPQILVQGSIFARMAPEQKTQLVEELQALNYCVGMCGDGANDCGALKAADAGISLSEAEASVASAFTSKIDNIECVPLIIREGRCSLITSFGLFKYMAMYSLIQFMSVLILYSINTNLGDFQFLYIDLIITTSIALLMGKTGPAKELCPERPQGSLISIPVLGSLLLQTFLVLGIQIGCYFITNSEDWFVPVNATSLFPKNLPNYENTALFCVSGYQYLIVAIVLSKGYPFRKPLYTNVIFLLVLLVLFGLMVWITLYPAHFLLMILQLKEIDDMNFKLLLIGLCALHFICAFMLEMAIEYGMLNCLRRLRGQNESKKAYKRLELYLKQQPSWPPLEQVIQAKPGITIHIS
ncbi:cation-transporting ATPase 13A2 [Erpetoichthys calabaricus]|uniref:cation-transporting ATPase 13A2 n=1 Tax=Erpetoichthys calabaricus TaxID=27687 RepID=UPI0022348BD1|nr:cation-transporting ATPase 13A2 [Erpetoichthys calabaricus]